MTVRGWITTALLVCVAAPGAAAQAPTASGTRAFVVEALGGTAGSAAGVVLGVGLSGVDRCPEDDDVECVLGRLSVVAIGSVVGATTGTTVVGHLVDSHPSTAGAVVGSLAGVAAGVGMLHLLTQVAGRDLGRASSTAVYAVTQGLVTALGSRVGAWMRDRR